MKSKRNITIKVIDNNNISLRQLAKYFVCKYNENIEKKKIKES